MGSIEASTPAQRDADERDCEAWNAAFYELGLRWHWDLSTYRELADVPSERERLRRYLQAHQPHLLKAYDADFLIDAVQARRSKCLQQTVASSAVRFDWSEARGAELGV